MAKGLTSLISSYVGSSMPISMSQLYSHHAARPSYHFSILAWLFVEYCDHGRDQYVTDLSLAATNNSCRFDLSLRLQVNFEVN